MTLDSRIGLVLEGGGMRGVFTSGVLDFMLDHDINFRIVSAFRQALATGYLT